ncbi:MAG: class I SAM-dependent methyltransferase [Actinobacteria bacterium]|nr:class I SAM-dependent methyltransferase [Actinomycetota bacterium]
MAAEAVSVGGATHPEGGATEEAAVIQCRSCAARLTRTFVDLGVMPLANAYLTREQLAGERSYPLHARVCEKCLLVQVDAVVSAEELFSDYAYFSSYSDSWLDHARRFSEKATRELSLNDESLVIEIASNDGYLLKNFRECGIPVLGVEPASNVAKVAVDSGVPTVVEFFGLQTADRLASRGKQANLVVANNVVAHVPDLHGFLAGIPLLLEPEGVFSVEVPHVRELIEQVQFDTIYHEHFSYFSLLVLEQALESHGLRVFDVERLPTHGGSLRVWACHVGATRPTSGRVAEARQLERQSGLYDLETYLRFSEAVDRCRDGFLEFIGRASLEEKSIVAYGAAAKGSTFLNYCKVSSADIPYVVDRSPHKQGHFLPGSHLPVEAPERLRDTKPDYVLLLPWNLRDEVMTQVSFIRDWGGRLVTAIPRIAVEA